MMEHRVVGALLALASLQCLVACTQGSVGAQAAQGDAAAVVRATAARDLRCPADQIALQRLPQWGGYAIHVADGCGQRATYHELLSGSSVVYVLTSRFALEPPARPPPQGP
jgi:hypothetical protein